MAEVENAVTRPHWEPRHEWESRVKFVEDNVGEHGLEKTVTLSIVWANMKFLGCSYPPGTEKLVDNYPVPSFEELKARRRAKESLKRGTSEGDSPTSPKKPKLDIDAITDVSSLIATIRSQSEKNQQGGGGGFIPEFDKELSRRVPRLIQTVANAMCLCKECIGEESIGDSERVKSMLQKYADSNDDNSFKFEFKEEEITPVIDGSQEGGGHKCTLLINGESIAEKVTAEKNKSKSAVSAEVLKMVDDWQEAHGKPSCPKLAAQYANAQPRDEYDGASGGGGTPSSRYYDHNRAGGNSYYNQQPRGGRGYNYQRSPGEQQRSRYSSEYYMPPPGRAPSSGGRSGRGYNGGGRGYQYGGSRY
jgi:hypothetical protein